MRCVKFVVSEASQVMVVYYQWSNFINASGVSFGAYRVESDMSAHSVRPYYRVSGMGTEHSPGESFETMAQFEQHAYSSCIDDRISGHDLSTTISRCVRKKITTTLPLQLAREH